MIEPSLQPEKHFLSGSLRRFLQVHSCFKDAVIICDTVSNLEPYMHTSHTWAHTHNHTYTHVLTRHTCIHVCVLQNQVQTRTGTAIKRTREHELSMFFLLVQIYFGIKETIGGIILSLILLHLNPTDLTDSSEEPSYMSQDSRNPNQHHFLTSFLPQSHHAGGWVP